MRNTTFRPLLTLLVAAALTLFGGLVPLNAQLATPSPSSSTTLTTVAPTTTTAPPTTAPPTTAVAPAPAPETKIILMPGPEETKLDPGKSAGATTTVKPGEPTAGPTITTPPPSLTAGQVDMVLRDQQRTGASSTSALVEALKPLQKFGMTAQEALTLGMGQFPMLGVANWTDDWLDYRSGPPPHQHQGTDVFSAFDTPVRAPVDGVVRFEDAGLGGKGAFVTAPDGTFYYMAHLNSFNRELASGAAVKQGQVIAYNGDSGNAGGGAPHVHLEIHPRGGAAVNPKPFLDAWLATALAAVPDLIASFEPKPAAGSDARGDDVGVPQILVATGLTRRFSTPSQPIPSVGRPVPDFNRAVLGPLTPTALAPLLEP